MPPFFSREKLAPRPTVVKKASMKGSWKVLVKLKVKVPVVWPAKVMNIKMKPPMTGAGIQYLARKLTLFLIA